MERRPEAMLDISVDIGGSWTFLKIIVVVVVFVVLVKVIEVTGEGAERRRTLPRVCAFPECLSE